MPITLDLSVLRRIVETGWNDVVDFLSELGIVIKLQTGEKSGT